MASSFWSRLFAARTPPVPPPPPDDDEDEDEEDIEKRRRFLVVWFDYALGTAEERVSTLGRSVARRAISIDEWASEFRALMESAHIEAWSIGRRLAGDGRLFDPSDARAGSHVWREQDEEFFGNFLRDLRQGRYGRPGTTAGPDAFREAQVVARSRSYARATRGTVHEAFADSLPETEQTWWELGEAEHCAHSPRFRYNCPDLAAGSPYPAGELPTVPGRGDTPCVNECHCHLRTASGYSTQGI